jgi:hypothetical protein
MVYMCMCEDEWVKEDVRISEGRKAADWLPGIPPG